MTDLTPKEQYDLERQKRLAQEQRGERWRTGSRALKWSVITILIVGVLGAGAWYVAKNTLPLPDETDVTKACIEHGTLGMHIHPHVEISIKGKNIPIPANVGIDANCMHPIHTHDASGTLHLEFLTKRDVKMGEFFKIWNKQFSSTNSFQAHALWILAMEPKEL
ncbi:MAG: hypothetical protein KW806_02255 [Candidatus Yanofskybacteria bacterium]|nr:hypothetical protein [Candidatus Yanofskybacteria bacterium]